MKTKQEIIDYCLSLVDAYLDYPSDERLTHVAQDDLLAVLNMTTDIGRYIREVYEHPDEYGEAIFKPDNAAYEAALKKLGTIGRSPEGYLRMLVPPLINRRNDRFGTSYDGFYSLLRSEFQADRLPIVDGPQVFVYKRYTKNIHSQNCMDNENVDAQNLTNAVCDALRISDGPATASFYYGAVASSIELTELTLIPLSEVGLLPAILAPTEPEIFSPDGVKIIL